jgi:hypothetical protein
VMPDAEVDCGCGSRCFVCARLLAARFGFWTVRN